MVEDDDGLRTIAAYGSREGSRAYLAKEDPRDEARAATIYEIVDDLDLAGARVLDVGCGSGRDMARFQAMGAEVQGVDASAAMVEAARARRPGLAPSITTGRVDVDGGLPEGAFDLVWCCACLLHVPRARLGAALDNLVAATAPGGRLVVVGKEAGPRHDDAIGAWRLMENHDHVDVLVATMAWMRLERLERGFAAPSGNTFYSMRLRRFGGAP